ncbi:MAG: GGDEF domain-containing protein [Thermodesulfobacteriota bacterium]
MPDGSQTHRLAFDAQELARLCQFGVSRSLQPGESIFSMGDIDRCMYYIASGEVELIFAGGKESKTIMAGDFFGEIAFILQEAKRSATARAKTDCILVRFDQSSFDQLIDGNPRLLLTLLRDTCSTLLKSEQGLISNLMEKNRALELNLDYLRRTREELDSKELIAQTDELTGLYNRRCLNAQLDKFLQRARNTGRDLCMIMLDLDKFKLVNDTWGHQQGDEVLRTVARTLKATTRASDLVCRLGGDEFTVLLPDANLRQGIEVAEKLRCAIFKALPEDAAGIQVTSSLGLAAFDGRENAETFIARADRCLYLAKDAGRNRVVADRCA